MLNRQPEYKTQKQSPVKFPNYTFIFFPQGSCDYDCKRRYILKHKLKQKRMHQIMLRFIIFVCCPINNTLHIVHHTIHYSFFIGIASSPITFPLSSWGKRKKKKEIISSAINQIVKHCIFLDRTQHFCNCFQLFKSYYSYY